MVSIISEIQHLLVCVIAGFLLRCCRSWSCHGAVPEPSSLGALWQAGHAGKVSSHSDFITSHTVSSGCSWISWAINWWGLVMSPAISAKFVIQSTDCMSPKSVLRVWKKWHRGFFEYEGFKIFLQLIYPLSHPSYVLLSNRRVHWDLKLIMTVSEVSGNRRGDSS